MAKSEIAASLILVTGPSGAGRTTAIQSLEDMGYETIDNLPLSLLPRLLEDQQPAMPLALGVDARNRDFSTLGLIDLIEQGGLAQKTPIHVLYLDASAEELVRRYSATRRRHPLAPAETPEIGIEREFDLLKPIRARADIVIDTTAMSPHDLKSELLRWFDTQTHRRLAVSLQSFSYKRGLPRGLDMVFDCRFLKNPYWEESLRSFDGRHPDVASFILQDEMFAGFVTRVRDLVLDLLPAYRAEGKAYLSIGFGCTGGQHRSVCVAETLAQPLAERDWQVSIRHRELERRGLVGPGLQEKGKLS
ncbi:MAG: RNase adapter RapZ [Pseudomonadota bacterium]